MRDLSFEPLTPTSFLRRSASVFTHRTAVVDGESTFSYAELWQRAQLLAGALRGIGVADGERVAVLAPNTHMLLEATFGIPVSGAIMVPLNIRLAPLYGLTETFGSAVICQPQPEWATLDPAQLAGRTARQGVIAQPVRVIDGDGNDVPADAVGTGEIAVRGNDVMLGYHRDPEATRAPHPMAGSAAAMSRCVIRTATSN